uniref:DUF8207 domain-containing protein n=1 Tax=Trichogramma kaykai TaxID=54128 RepID=A0ABD2X5H4_9HYME
MNQPKYKFLKDLLEPIDGVRYLPFSEHETVLSPDEALPNSLMIFDDVGCEKQDNVRAYFCMGRHKNVDSFYLCQSYAHVPKHLVRDNVNLLVIFRQDDVNLRHIYDDHVNTDMSYLVFKELCANCWNSDQHSFLVIDKDRAGHIIVHYRANISEREQRILHELIKSREAIRRKALMLKRGRDETERTVTETFKPIIKPINKLVTLNEEKIEDSENVQTLKLENIKEESSISKENTDQVTEDEEDAAAASIADGEDEMTRDYLNLVKMQSDELDKLYGVRMQTDEYYLGNSPLRIDEDMVYIGNESYIKFKGLLELLFKKNPDPKHITNTDTVAYEKILDSTNVHRKRFADDGDLCKHNSKKFEYIIEPLFKSGSGLSPRYKVVKRGYSLLPRYKVAKSHGSLKDFVYWNDPNELVDRLRLLVAERSAGNNAHDNEITSIIEELREDGYIY